MTTEGEKLRFVGSDNNIYEQEQDTSKIQDPRDGSWWTVGMLMAKHNLCRNAAVNRIKKYYKGDKLWRTPEDVIDTVPRRSTRATQGLIVIKREVETSTEALEAHVLLSRQAEEMKQKAAALQLKEQLEKEEQLIAEAEEHLDKTINEQMKSLCSDSKYGSIYAKALAISSPVVSFLTDDEEVSLTTLLSRE